MTEQVPENNLPEQPQLRAKRIIKWVVFSLLGLLFLLLVALGFLASSDKGSRWLLELIMNRQQIVQYQYEKGNLINGLNLKNIVVKVKNTELKIDQAEVRPGWRAIMSRELHFMTISANQVEVIDRTPPSNKPFQFSELKLPFTLRLNDAKVNKLTIQNTTTKVNFYHIELHDSVWSGTKIDIEKAALAMDYLNVQNVRGYIEFNKKYPLDVKADLTIPSLQGLNLQQISVVARGDLDTVRAGIASATPDIITGYVVAHPVRKNVPMSGQLNWEKFRWPFAVEQQFNSERGKLAFSGDLARLNLNLDSDLAGKNVPKGNYQAAMFTDLKKLQIDQFIGEVMNGEINLAGVVDWQKGVNWNIQGNMQGISPKNQNIPEVVRDFLPPNINGAIASKGTLDKKSEIAASIDFDKYEKWQINLVQNSNDKKQQPWLINVAWNNFDREIPYVGWLKSQKGQVDLTLSDRGDDIVLATDIEAHEKSSLPAGHYAGVLNYAKNILNIKSFAYSQGQSKLLANAVINLPTEKTQLKWQANLNTQQFNPQTVLSALPVNLLNGSLKANGYANTNQQIIRLENINLQGRLAQESNQQTIQLKGRSTIALVMGAGQQSGLHSYAVLYNGQLAAQNYTEGPLRLKLSGTPDVLKITEFYHQGAAGQINANGLVNLAGGFKWNIQAALQQFKPQFFVSGLNGELTGAINTTGQWSDRTKYLSVQNLNLYGRLNNQPVLGRGNLALSFNDAHGFVPQQFEANNLILSYANNVVHATGNAQRLQLNVNAPNLSEIYSGLRGTIKGFISLQSRPQLNAQANLVVQNLGFTNLLNVERMSVVGTLPTGNQPTRLLLQLQNARSGERQVRQAKIDLVGTRAAHVVNIEGENRLSKFSVRLAGGLNSNNDWYGQIQNGLFNSKRTQLKQNQAASLIYLYNKSQLSITAHCWISQNNTQNQICLDQPLLASKAQGAISVAIKNIELGDFQAFMPSGLALTGKVNGYTHLSWLNNQPMQLDTQLITQNGSIALSNDDEDAEDLTQSDNTTTALKYNQVRIIAKTLPQGLSLKVNADTPLLGTGYLNVLVGTQSQNKSLSGDIVLDEVKLNILKPFISDVRVLDGKLSAAGKLNGTLSAPLFNGEIRLRDGRLAMISVPVDLRNIQLQSSIRGNQATLLGGFNSGRGVGKITGNANWSGSPHIQLSVIGQELLVAQPPTISASVSPNIDIDIRPNIRQLTVSGKVDVPRAVISMPESSANVVNTSSDVRVVRSSDDQLALLAAARPWNIRANIAINLGNQVIFRGFNSVIPLVGRLNLSQRGTEIAMQGTGAIGVSRQVKIEAYGQSLDLNRAIARFNGELSNPALDIDATKDVDNNTIGLRITGVATRPNIQIYNDAGLSEQEALNALITGRISSGSSSVNNTEGFKSDVNNTLAAAGISMGLGGTRALTNQIGRSFGLSGLALDAQGSGNDTQVSVTGYITPDLYLRYGVGIFTPVNKLTLRYQVNRRLYMEASSSVERAVDLFYNWRF
ncbi:hypothetical protein F4V57_03260 [Acinetobacter qingfengensis]|uniref:Translocation and assembly module TamB C-terminal domain-containing protein n=1 Tax=Acinetobacter qingfengensis TaxID=1262585 RepID=A0A1E7RAU1_9GAMM|nr:translocation/assembly module TamB domain-containing protein [Acinetobacter qingfengensis]KAA8734793.1 hypothetical protein F4V57_03260 [Acinetobacter qingfengensis]OEY96421.1 hypothetical protein BJI46_12020 [Acinetobacter qingfengensis]